MTQSFLEILRRFRGTRADTEAGVFALIGIVGIGICFFGAWGALYAATVCLIVSLCLTVSLLRTLRAEKTEVRHV